MLRLGQIAYSMGWRNNKNADTRAIPPAELERARVEMIAGFLGWRNWLIPSWALVSIIPFLGPFPYFGKVAAWRLAIVVLAYLATGAAGEWLRAGYARDPADARRWRRRFTLIHALAGMSWGLFPWLLWVPDNSLNHAIVLLDVIAVVRIFGGARTSFWSHYLAGIGPIVAMTMLRLLTAQTIEAPGLTVIFGAVVLYTFALSEIVKRDTDRGMATSYANRAFAAQLRTAHDEALEKRRDAEAANAAKSTFLANMSHELRTPLNAIIGFSELIATEALGKLGVPRYREYATDIHASGYHLLSIIDDILDIARIETGRITIAPEPLDARAVIGEALRLVAPRLREKGQHLSLRVADDATLFADKRAFKRVVVNLLDNAVKFTQADGAIVMRGRTTDDGGFELMVADNGPGIASALLDRVFQPFSQIDNCYTRRQGGAGLGLSLVRGLLQSHGGRAWIETEAGCGVRAFAWFPQGPAASRPAPVDETRLSA
jgi:two-component system cell cycle sensor histidine kinase PleC